MGIVIFGSKMVRNFDYSYILCTIAGILCIICSVLIHNDRKPRHSTDSSVHRENNIESRGVIEVETDVPQILTNSTISQPDHASSLNHSQNIDDLPPTYDEITLEPPPPSYHDVVTQQKFTT
jgi:hypothetical protein